MYDYVYIFMLLHITYVCTYMFVNTHDHIGDYISFWMILHIVIQLYINYMFTLIFSMQLGCI